MLGAMASSWFPLYRALAATAAPLAARRLARAVRDDRTLLARQPERRGRVPDAGGELWIHAASVGEVNAVAPLVDALLENPARHIVLSTLTHTGARRAASRWSQQARLRHVFAPLDTAASVQRWLDHTRPDRLLLVETELWPVLLRACRSRAIPVAMVNARVSARALRRYLRFRRLFADALSAVAPVLCQGEADRQRLLELGASPAATRVTGNLKFEVYAPGTPGPDVLAWRQARADRPVWVAGSTHAGEEAIVGRAHRRLLDALPGARVVVVPRHPERAPEAAAALAGAGLKTGRIDEPGDADALVVDRMGVLAGLYAVADAAFVGGSLAPGVGGHNLLEPALAARPVLTGPYRDDQQEAAELLAEADALQTVRDAQSLSEALLDVLSDRAAAQARGQRARAAARAGRGALQASLQALRMWMREPAGDG
jgi:3-deoxy-D-manno-octulosonic-acid transferase